MTVKTQPAEVWAEYEKCKSYNNAVGLYEQVRQNEDFYIGDQWKGMKAPDLDKPVLNILKRVVTFFIATLVTDNVGIAITPQTTGDADKQLAKILETELDTVIEDNKIISLNRKALRNAAVDGKAYYYSYYDTDKERIATELLENTRVLFGNPYVCELQKQPYILIVKQMLLDTVKGMASPEDRDRVRPDVDEPWNEEHPGYGADRTTVLVKLWREGGTVRFTQVTRDVVVKEPTDTGYKSYPLASMAWEEIRDSYQGQAAVTGLIPNQIAINKLWAMAIRHQQMMAFPKIFYDCTKIPRWDNRVGAAVGVPGNPNEAVAANFRAADMSDQLLGVVDSTINYTKDLMGASDAALGNVKPDNTSAIIAVQKASSAPLELQRLAFYLFMEDYIRTSLELICAHYGARPVRYTAEGNEPAAVLFDFGAVDIEQIDWRVDVGASAYWSELTQIQTLDNLYGKQILQDPLLYLENIPDEYIKNKNDVIESVRRQQELQAQLLAAQQAAVNPAIPGAPQTEDNGIYAAQNMVRRLEGQL